MAGEPELCPKEVVELAEEIRDENHPELEGARIAYVFIPKGPISGGKKRFGSAHKQSAVAHLLNGYDFVVRLSKDVWEKMNNDERLAALDHELCHCAPKLDENGTFVGWQIRKHDVEEFAEIIERHGLWKRDVQDFARATCRQLGLPFEEAELQTADSRQ